ncbi:signal-transducing histidine kinase [Halanaeroarchaeum sulfurireducens]|uniref:histidine kinase n=1 Tax=Halanaeroarchaeum sulfurireducens TaxID=1604004 RepID=A0A0N9MXJ7_9EURY|nr:ATP-binding protein [Halanaeroarchaeum sulfurireducens]ALG82755.1 signal-transducing histidine kinase [Halanaeroarchaeum sulfurireducens]
MTSSDSEAERGDPDEPNDFEGDQDSCDVLWAFQSIYDVTTDSTLSFEEKIDRLLTIGVDAIGLPYGFLSRIAVDDTKAEEGVQEIYRSHGDHELLQPGESAPLSEAYCRKTIQSDGLLAIRDAVEEGWEGDPAYETFDLGSYIGGRVDVNDELYGTFCFAATEPKERTFTDAERTLVQILSKWASYELEQERAKRNLETQRDELENAQEQLRQVIDLVPDLIFAKNRDGQYLLANEATANAYGRTPEEVEGSTEADLIPDRSQSEEFREDDIAVIESGEPKFIPEEELTTADGETRILETTKIPFEVAGSGEDAVLGYARDITDLKEYERELENQRDDLEVLSQVVRHDIRNDLQLVLAYTEMLKSSVDEEGERYVEQVLEAARDAVDITTTAREVADIMLQSEVTKQPKQLRHELEEAINSVRESNHHGLITVDGPLPNVAVLADDMLESVFRNLLKNAIIHNDKEILEVTVGATKTEDTVVVTVADNGPGIPDDRKESIFEEGEMGLESDGTGIGLYLVDKLVDRYGGTVTVEDNDPVGAVFVVELPIAK